jgi:hypothetical protein
MTRRNKLEHLLDMQPQRLVMLDINLDSYNDVVWITSKFSRPLKNKFRLCRKLDVRFQSLLTLWLKEICKTSMRPNIRDDAIIIPRVTPTTPRSFFKDDQWYGKFPTLDSCQVTSFRPTKGVKLASRRVIEFLE